MLFLVKLPNKDNAMIRIFLTLVLLLHVTHSQAMFKSSDCVVQSFQGSFDIEKGPFGVMPLVMNLKKNRCIIEIERNLLFKASWQIDLCREPVHIKQKTWSGEGFQIRKAYPCKDDTVYCQQVDDLISSIENEALIYAKGERESLTTDHGKFFCAYLLLKNYLKEGKVFSLTVPTSVNIFEKTTLEHFGQEPETVIEESATPAAVTTPLPEPTKVKF